MPGENSEENQFESSAFHLQKLKEVNSESKGLEEAGGARQGRGAHTEDLTAPIVRCPRSFPASAGNGIGGLGPDLCLAHS